MQTNHHARAASGQESVIPADLSPMDRLSAQADAGVTPAGRMAVALTIMRTRNARVLAGTALQSPIFGGVDPEEVRRRRAKGKAQRAARKSHRASK